MKIQVYSNHKTPLSEMAAIINTVSDSMQNADTIEGLYNIITEWVGNLCFFECGRGGSHIWIKNAYDETIIQILY